MVHPQPKTTSTSTPNSTTSSSSTSSMSSSDDSMAISVALACLLTDQEESKPRRRSVSRPGRRSNRERGRGMGADQLDRDYFCRYRPQLPIFEVQEFEKRFTVSRTIYETLRAGLCNEDYYFVQRKDGCEKNGASTDQKLCAALRMLSTKAAADALVDYFRLSETTILLSLKRFCRAICTRYATTYLRRPNQSDIKRIEAQYRRLGFPACFGCLVCSGWQWDNCPVGMHGQFIGKEGKPSLRMEVVCDDQLWVWHLMFGVPGAKNGKSILNQSFLFNDIRSGKWPPMKPNANIGGTLIDWFYYLADGIYPRFQLFAKPHPNPNTAKAKLYTAAHSSDRKSVERVFGVLDLQFEILHFAARLSNLNVLNDIVSTCGILHNMIVEERGYAGTAKFRVDSNVSQTLRSSFTDVQQRTHCSYEQSSLWGESLEFMESLENHQKLQQALMDNLWNIHGETAN